MSEIVITDAVVDRDLATGNYAMTLIRKDEGAVNGSVYSFGSMTLYAVTPGVMAPYGSTAFMSKKSLQVMADALWDAGIRPTKKSEDRPAPVSGTSEAHIADLREIVWHLLGRKEQKAETNNELSRMMGDF